MLPIFLQKKKKKCFLKSGFAPEVPCREVEASRGPKIGAGFCPTHPMMGASFHPPGIVFAPIAPPLQPGLVFSPNRDSFCPPPPQRSLLFCSKGAVFCCPCVLSSSPASRSRAGFLHPPTPKQGQFSTLLGLIFAPSTMIRGRFLPPQGLVLAPCYNQGCFFTPMGLIIATRPPNSPGLVFSISTNFTPHRSQFSHPATTKAHFSPPKWGQFFAPRHNWGCFPR